MNNLRKTKDKSRVKKEDKKRSETVSFQNTEKGKGRNNNVEDDKD